MNMMDGIAATASSLASAQLQQSYTLAVSKKAMEVPGAGSTGVAANAPPLLQPLAISLMSTPEQKQAWILCAEYPCLLFTINASDPRCCPEPVCTAGMTHIRAPFYVIWFRVLRLIPFV